MDDLTPWEDIGGTARRELSPPAAGSLPVEVRRRDIRDLVPVSRDEFFASVAPCLTLAAGVGMSPDDQDAWMEAAYQALDGIPIALLERGAEAAMRSADHPSKIIPAIMAEIGESWRWRREYRASTSAQPVAEPAEATEDRCTPEQARAILKEFGLASAFPSNRNDLAP